MNRKDIEDSARLMIDKIMMDEKVYRLVVQMKEYDDVLFTHSHNVAFIVAQICYSLSYSKKARYELVTAALLHDVGKMKISRAILNKQGPLTEAEYQTIKNHVKLGEEILEEAGFNKNIIKSMSMHHEKIDGSGYPRGLKNSEITKNGQILAAVDMYDAITAKRPYHEAVSLEKAMNILNESKTIKPKYIEYITRCEAI